MEFIFSVDIYYIIALGIQQLYGYINELTPSEPLDVSHRFPLLEFYIQKHRFV